MSQEAKIVCIYNQKGGVAKTTVTMQLAGTLGKTKKTLVIDIDPQGTSTDWHANSQGKFPADILQLDSNKPDFLNIVESKVSSYDYIIFDCPPSDTNIGALKAIMVANLMLVPFKPSPTDITPTLRIIGVAKEAKKTNPDLIVRLIPVMMQPNTNLHQQTVNALDTHDDVTFFRTILAQRNAYPESFLIGSTVHNVAGAKKAQMEVDAMVTEVKKILK